MIFMGVMKPENLLAQDKVSIEIISQDGSTNVVQFNWPFNGPAPAEKSKELVAQVSKILHDNGIDCPPQREKLSDAIWRCGNGKKIRTKDSELTRLLSKAWD